MLDLYGKFDSGMLLKKYRRQKLLAILTALASLLVLTVNFLLSDEETKNIFLIANIGISLAAGWFLLTFVLYHMRNTKNALGFFRKIEASEKKECAGKVLELDASPLTLHGRVFLALTVRLADEGERLFYLPHEREYPALKPDVQIKLRVADNFVLAYGVENE